VLRLNVGNHDLSVDFALPTSLSELFIKFGIGGKCDVNYGRETTRFIELDDSHQSIVEVEARISQGKY
jgi:hypothetical protein